MATIEDILIQRALADEQSRPQQIPMVAAGAGLGAYLGQGVGAALNAPFYYGSKGARSMGRGVKNLLGMGPQTEKALRRQGRQDLKREVKDRLHPESPRMAGGLIGMMLGGGLGEGVRQLAIQESPAARVLAKIQTQGRVTPEDQAMIETLLAESYSNQSRYM